MTSEWRYGLPLSFKNRGAQISLSRVQVVVLKIVSIGFHQKMEIEEGYQIEISDFVFLKVKKIGEIKKS